MSEVPSREVKPYLNPDYWSGHMIGHGPDSSGDFPAISTLWPGKSASERNFQERLKNMRFILPIETFGAYDIFDPSEHSEGTIVMYREESLSGDPAEVPDDAEALKAQPLATRPTIFASRLGGRSSPPINIHSGSLTYRNLVMCGFVDKPKKGKKKDGHVVHAVTASSVTPTSTGEVTFFGSFYRTYAEPIAVGETAHAESGGLETLHRVNLLEVIAYGSTEKQSERAEGILSRLSLRSQRA